VSGAGTGGGGGSALAAPKAPAVSAHAARHKVRRETSGVWAAGAAAASHDQAGQDQSSRRDTAVGHVSLRARHAPDTWRARHAPSTAHALSSAGTSHAAADKPWRDKRKHEQQSESGSDEAGVAARRRPPPKPCVMTMGVSYPLVAPGLA